MEKHDRPKPTEIDIDFIAVTDAAIFKTQCCTILLKIKLIPANHQKKNINTKTKQAYEDRRN